MHACKLSTKKRSQPPQMPVLRQENAQASDFGNFLGNQAGKPLAGVGIFFQTDENDRPCVADIVPDSSAEACGVIYRDDILKVRATMVSQFRDYEREI